MQLDITRNEDVTVLEFKGDFDAFNLAPTAKKIDELIDAGEVKLVLDLKRLWFINSSALGYLIKMRKRCLAAEGDVVLVQPSLFLRKTLVTLGLDKLFLVYQTVEDAVGRYTGARRVHNKADLGDQIDEKLLGANALIFTLVPPVGTKVQVGSITSLYTNGLKARWSVPRFTPDSDLPLTTATFDLEIYVGRKVKIKFRQPFMAKDHYVETDAVITHLERELLADGTDEAVFILRYENAKPEDLEMLSRFVHDIAELKAEIDQARGQ